MGFRYFFARQFSENKMFAKFRRSKPFTSNSTFRKSFSFHSSKKPSHGSLWYRYIAGVKSCFDFRTTDNPGLNGAAISHDCEIETKRTEWRFDLSR